MNQELRLYRRAVREAIRDLWAYGLPAIQGRDGYMVALYPGGRIARLKKLESWTAEHERKWKRVTARERRSSTLDDGEERMTGGMEKQFLARRQSEAHRVAAATYTYKCCCICGMLSESTLDVAHLDQNPENNDPDNLAYLCKTHHWMFDARLYPIEIVKALRANWQATRGIPDHSARMKDAGAKAALRRKRRAAADKAVATRKARERARQLKAGSQSGDLE